jgi:hypothetical protein
LYLSPGTPKFWGRLSFGMAAPTCAQTPCTQTVGSPLGPICDVDNWTVLEYPTPNLGTEYDFETVEWSGTMSWTVFRCHLLCDPCAFERHAESYTQPWTASRTFRIPPGHQAWFATCLVKSHTEVTHTASTGMTCKDEIDWGGRPYVGIVLQSFANATLDPPPFGTPPCP